MDIKTHSCIVVVFTSHVYISRNLNIDIWHIVNLRQYNSLILNQNILTHGFEWVASVFRAIPCKSISKKANQAISYLAENVWNPVLENIGKYWDFKIPRMLLRFQRCRAGKRCPFQHTGVTTGKLSANWLLAAQRHEAVWRRVQMNK